MRTATINVRLRSFLLKNKKNVFNLHLEDYYDDLDRTASPPEYLRDAIIFTSYCTIRNIKESFELFVQSGIKLKFTIKINEIDWTNFKDYAYENEITMLFALLNQFDDDNEFALITV